MAETSTKAITGVFVALYRSPLRVVFRYHVNYRWDHYEVFKPWQKIDAVVEVLQRLSKERPEFVARIMAVDETYYRQSSHRTRHYVHIDRDKLYDPDRKDLVQKYSRKVGELWLDTDLNEQGKFQVIMEACEAAEVEYGSLSAVKW
jgi:hypothetical protein